MTEIGRHSRKGADKRPPAAVVGTCILGALVAAATLVAGVVWCFARLSEIHDERCRVTDPDLEVVITSGRMVSADVVVAHFGLTNGANLAQIDFAARRAKFLAKIPNVRDVHVERRLPNRVTVEVFEREPIARVAGGSTKKPDGRVVDAEGVVFTFARNVSNLPVIREAEAPRTRPGEKLKAMGAAAIQLVQQAADPAFIKLDVREIDVTKPDRLVLLLGDGAKANIAWQNMGDKGKTAQESLVRQLGRLRDAIVSRVQPGTRFWDAMDWNKPGYVYARDPARARYAPPEGNVKK